MGEDFIPSESYSGTKDGYVFKTGVRGLGYYIDIQETIQPNTTKSHIYELPVMTSPYNAATAIATPPVPPSGPVVKYYDRSTVFPTQVNNGKAVPNVNIFPFFNGNFARFERNSLDPQVGFMPNWLMDTCGFKIVMGGVIGYIMGTGLGLFMSGMNNDVSPIQILHGREVPQAPLREQMRSGYKSVLSKSLSWGKNFGVISCLFGGIECVIQKYRAKHDSWNPVLSGCTVGVAMGYKAGPAAACISCAGFAGFGFLMDKIMSGRH